MTDALTTDSMTQMLGSGLQSGDPDDEAHTLRELPASGAVSASSPGRTTTPIPAMPGVGTLSFLEFLNILLRQWKLVVGFPLLTAVAAVAYSLVLPPKFTATATFVPEKTSNQPNVGGGLAGLAGQFGIEVSGGAESPAFYAELLRSRTLADELLETKFASPRPDTTSERATLLDILDVEGSTKGERLAEGRKALAGALSVSVDNQTNIVALSMEVFDPVLSADVVNALIDHVSRFNLETRQTNARQRRRFIDGQLADAARELEGTEEQLKSFLERNRQFVGSPELQFQHDRLQRQVAIRQEVFTTLRLSYEEARIQEANDAPVITVIDRAVPPEEKSSPKRRLNVMLAFVLGGVIAVLGAFGREFVDRTRETEKEAFQEFTSRWAGIAREIRSVTSRTKPSS